MVANARLALWIVAFGTTIIGLMSLGIVGAAIYESIEYGKSPEILNNWGGLIIGFFIGSLFSFVRTAVGLPEQDSKRTEPGKPSPEN
jgi:hypothetical protein